VDEIATSAPNTVVHDEQAAIQVRCSEVGSVGRTATSASPSLDCVATGVSAPPHATVSSAASTAAHILFPIALSLRIAESRRAIRVDG
jgi:hypothetical protein